MNVEYYMFNKYHYDAKGVYKSNGTFTVFENSSVRVDSSKSKKYINNVNKTRDYLIQKGILEFQENKLVFTRDYDFNSPSLAAAIVKGRDCNGWYEWTTNNNVSLNNIERKDAENDMDLSSIEIDLVESVRRLIDSYFFRSQNYNIKLSMS